MPRKSTTKGKKKKKATTTKSKTANATKGKKEATAPFENGLRLLPAELLLNILKRLNVKSVSAVIKVSRSCRAVFTTYHETISKAALHNTPSISLVAELFAEHADPGTLPKQVQKLPHVQSLRHMLKVQQLCKATCELALKLDAIEKQFINGNPNRVPGSSMSHTQGLANRWILSKVRYSERRPSSFTRKTLFYYAAVRSYLRSQQIDDILRKLPYQELNRIVLWRWMKERCDNLLLLYFQDKCGNVSYASRRGRLSRNADFHLKVFLRHTGSQWLLDLDNYTGEDEGESYGRVEGKTKAIAKKVERVWENYGHLYEQKDPEW